MAPFYQQSDCLAIPSFYDPFANVTLEALAMGLYAVSSKTNGGHEILTPEKRRCDRVAHRPILRRSRARAGPKAPQNRAAAPKAIRDSVQHLDFARNSACSLSYEVPPHPHPHLPLRLSSLPGHPCRRQRTRHALLPPLPRLQETDAEQPLPLQS